MENLEIFKAEKKDIDIVFDLINGLALYEKRPQDMTGTKEELSYWLFDRNIATTFIAQYNGENIGYALYYPIFGSFSAKGKIHLEDLFIKEEYRGKGFGKYFFAKVAEDAYENGYMGMEWSCLDWNTPSIAFYKKLEASEETGRVYFDFSKADMERIKEFAK